MDVNERKLVEKVGKKTQLYCHRLRHLGRKALPSANFVRKITKT